MQNNFQIDFFTFLLSSTLTKKKLKWPNWHQEINQKTFFVERYSCWILKWVNFDECMQNDESNNEHGVFSFQPEAKLFVRSIVDVFYITWLTHDIVSACLCLSVGGSLACTDQCTHTHTRTYVQCSESKQWLSFCVCKAI